MLEKNLRPRLDDALFHPLGNILSKTKVSPASLTLLSLFFGIAASCFIFLGYSIAALCFLWGSGLLDVLDGTVARISQSQSNQGAILDIVSDRLVEFSVVMGFYFVDPEGRGLLCLLMLGSILLCVTTFLVVGIVTENTSEKSFYYSPGLVERAEAFIFFSLMILFPQAFLALSALFVILVFLTAFIRIYQAKRKHDHALR